MGIVLMRLTWGIPYLEALSRRMSGFVLRNRELSAVRPDRCHRLSGKVENGKGQFRTLEVVDPAWYISSEVIE